MYQLTFAIITPALVIGAYAERVKFSGMLLFSLLWLLLVYCPVAHWVWGDGWLAKMGLMDFAGGTVVHLNAGIAALVCALVLGRRRGFPETPMPPHNMTMTVTGACMLWVGWFGFNAGSALAADGAAGMAMLVTHIGAATGAFAWMVCEWMRYGKPSVLGDRDRHGRRARHDHAGLGLRRAARRARDRRRRRRRVLLRHQLHEAGARAWTTRSTSSRCTAWAACSARSLTGVFAAAALRRRGLSREGQTMGDQVLVQLIGVLAVAAWSGVVTCVLLKVSDAVVGMRVAAEEETEGLDTVLHNEKGYNL